MLRNPIKAQSWVLQYIHKGPGGLKTGKKSMKPLYNMVRPGISKDSREYMFAVQLLLAGSLPLRLACFPMGAPWQTLNSYVQVDISCRELLG